ncbi:hypothetical protein SAMN04488132_104107 [Sediminibacterium ginsengisoli]|uniref:Uncharacterized protein n=1 Tax=Sediminibacterium ginsengisoli TaxID=413434 RepID=A0A1T4N663_9BACT|nr:hypothetical protein SAMN04488132_104107 [Sediminibacterium ginsengisoli]
MQLLFLLKDRKNRSSAVWMQAVTTGTVELALQIKEGPATYFAPAGSVSFRPERANIRLLLTVSICRVLSGFR